MIICVSCFLFFFCSMWKPHDNRWVSSAALARTRTRQQQQQQHRAGQSKQKQKLATTTKKKTSSSSLDIVCVCRVLAHNQTMCTHSTRFVCTHRETRVHCVSVKLKEITKGRKEDIRGASGEKKYSDRIWRKTTMLFLFCCQLCGREKKKKKTIGRRMEKKIKSGTHDESNGGLFCCETQYEIWERGTWWWLFIPFSNEKHKKSKWIKERMGNPHQTNTGTTAVHINKLALIFSLVCIAFAYHQASHARHVVVGATLFSWPAG